jgi:hypothetical protein
MTISRDVAPTRNPESAVRESVGLELSSRVLLHASVIERFIVQGTGTVSPATRPAAENKPARAGALGRGSSAAGAGAATARAPQGAVSRRGDRRLPGIGGRAREGCAQPR